MECPLQATPVSFETPAIVGLSRLFCTTKPLKLKKRFVIAPTKYICQHLTAAAVNCMPKPSRIALLANITPQFSHVDCQGDLLQSAPSSLLIPHPVPSRYSLIQGPSRQSVIRSHCRNSATLSSFVVKGAAPQTSRRGRNALTEMWPGSQQQNLSMHP